MALHRSSPLHCLLLSDGKPGHFHLSDGVVAGLSRTHLTLTTRLTVKRRSWLPRRVAKFLFDLSLCSPETLLKWVYDIDSTNIPQADLIVSSGGETLLANVLCRRLLGVDNIFCGTIRRHKTSNFSLVITSFSQSAKLPRHIGLLKPNSMDPEKITGKLRPLNQSPKQFALLIGGNAGTFKYSRMEWEKIVSFLDQSHQKHGIKWLVTTSRRTDRYIIERIKTLTKTSNAIQEFIDYKQSGPGVVPKLLSKANAVFCTEDSNSMIAEAITARLPVIGLLPQKHSFPKLDAQNRYYLIKRNWLRSIKISHLEASVIDNLLPEIEPMQENHLDILSGALQEHLPKLMKAHPSRLAANKSP